MHNIFTHILIKICKERENIYAYYNKNNYAHYEHNREKNTYLCCNKIKVKEAPLGADFQLGL